ncbi:hypothetical protein [Pedobacter duraquae]|uniref:Uncharacterized protein n=1 Tax=Pedobacter duraquae TaxID=425511 RepID=A0A4R6IIY1_9SPHI|nr:hypothetical protein [Pedobacter duraquae]TDO21886.1 hypothetical protein CLV32_2994 [Pedobacter duraquae]
MDLKDIAFALRAAYMAKLDNVLVVDSKLVPVYDTFVPNDAPSYFVVIKDHNEADNSTKQGFNTDVHITFDIVSRFPPGTGSSAPVDSVSNQLNSIIVAGDPANRISLLPDFNIMNAVRTLSRPITEESKVKNIFRKVNIYKHEIQQLT